MFNSQGPVGRSCGKSAKESMEATDSASLGKEDSSDSLSASVSSPADPARSVGAIRRISFLQ